MLGFALITARDSNQRDLEFLFSTLLPAFLYIILIYLLVMSLSRISQNKGCFTKEMCNKHCYLALGDNNDESFSAIHNFRASLPSLMVN